MPACAPVAATGSFPAACTTTYAIPAPRGSSGLSTDARPPKRDRTTEDRVVGAVWEELEGILVEQFRVPSDRPRYLDALIVEGPERVTLRGDRLPVLSDRRVWAVEAKAGAIDMGVLGQALFGAELARQVLPGVEVIPLAAAPLPPAEPLRQLLEHYQPAGLQWRAYPTSRRAGKAQRSSGEPNPPGLRTVMLDRYAAATGGTLVRVGRRRTRRDFASVTVAGAHGSLRPLGLSGLLLHARPPALALADEATLEISPDEPVDLIHTCTDLYRTQMGKALFSTELARRSMGLRHATGIALFLRDNIALRGLLTTYPHVRAVAGTNS